VNQPLRKQADVEPVFAGIKIDRFFFRREQIEQQGHESRLIERPRNKLIPWAVPAAPAAMCEKNQRLRLIHKCQIAVAHRAASRNQNFVHGHTWNGNVSGSSPLSQTLVRSSGSTARVSSM